MASRSRRAAPATAPAEPTAEDVTEDVAELEPVVEPAPLVCAWCGKDPFDGGNAETCGHCGHNPAG